MSRLPLLMGAASAGMGLAGMAWLLGAPGYPFGLSGDGTPVCLLGYVAEPVGAALVCGVGLAGLPTAVACARGRWTSSKSSLLLLLVISFQAVVFGSAAASLTVVIIPAYVLILVGLPVAAGILIVGAWRQRGLRLLLVGVLGMGILVQLITGLFDPDAFGDLASGLLGVPAKVGTRPMFVAASLVLAAGWVVLAVRGLRVRSGRCAECGRPGAGWTHPESAARWGRWATIVAALCPIPHALARVTWLLPNPIGHDAGELAAEPGIRLFGLGFGLVALLSGILTLGLIRPCGERWPRWVPGLADRPVPIRAVVIPGATAATILALSSMLMYESAGSIADMLAELVFFPFPLWSTSLALATAAYYYRRRGRCHHCGRGERLAEFRSGDVRQVAQ